MTQPGDLGDLISKTGCSADSFMIRDGVCDEITNIERCLYDGGDCCLAEKDTALCKVCTCDLVVEKDELQERILEVNLAKLENVDDFERLTKVSSMVVEDVVSLEVCSMVCLDRDLDNVANAWKYDKVGRTCECSWITSDSLCLTEVSLSHSHQFEILEHVEQDAAFIQKEKIVSCREQK